MSNPGYFDGYYLYYRISTDYPGEDIPLFTPEIKDPDGISLYTPVEYTFKNDSLGYSKAVTQWKDEGRVAVPFSLWNDNRATWQDWYVIAEYEDQQGNKEILDSGGVLTVEKTDDLQAPKENQAPTDIVLSSLSFRENTHSPVLTVSTSDPDSGDKHTYELVSGYGDDDNHLFSLTNYEQDIDFGAIGDGFPMDLPGGAPDLAIPWDLTFNGSADYESKSSYSIRLQTKDSGGLTYEKSFLISVIDVDEAPANRAPTAIELSAYSFMENIGDNTSVARLTTSDPDANDTFIYSLVSGSGDVDNSHFTIQGDQLKISKSPDYETKSSYSIRLRATDSGGLSVDQSFNLKTEDQDDIPPIVRGNSIYTIVDGPSWHDAEASSVRLGGHLVNIGSKEEDDFLTDLIRNYPPVSLAGPDSTQVGQRFYIGLTRQRSNFLLEMHSALELDTNININSSSVSVESDSETRRPIGPFDLWSWSNREVSTYRGALSQVNGNIRLKAYYSKIGSSLNDSGLWSYHEYVILPGETPDADWFLDNYGVNKGIAEIPFIRRGDSAYVIVEGPTWEEAEANAVALGGHLVTISSKAENDFLTANLFKGWIGLSDAQDEGMWRWSSGDEFVLEEWIKPIFNSDDAPPLGQDYVFFDDDHEDEIQWDSVHESQVSAYGIAEIQLAPNSTPSGTPTLSGNFKAGQVITIDRTPIQDADNFEGWTPTYKYSWESSTDGTTWHKLTTPDATDENNTYTLTTAEVGKQVRGVVSYVDGYGSDETIASQSVTVLSIDNQAPTDLRISPSAFDENLQAGTAVGSLISTDADSDDTFTYSLVSGTGDSDNTAFTIDGDQLRINASPDYELQSSYSIRVRTTDSGGLFHEDVLVLSVNDLDEKEEKDKPNTWEGSFENDSFFGGYEDIADIAYGYGGDDALYGGGGSDQLYGGDDQDLISGDEGDDELYGESGDDTLIGGTGQDLIDGGPGRDRLDYGNGRLPGWLFDLYGSQGITVDLRPGSAIGYSAGLQPLFEGGFPAPVDPDWGRVVPGIPGGGGGPLPNPNYGFADGAEIGFDSIIGIEDVITADGDDKIYGDDADNAIDAGGGDDLIQGNGGNDQLVGGKGNDSLDGGTGNDEAIYSGTRENYSVAHDSEVSIVTIADSRQYHDGTDTITGVELFKFADITLTLEELISSASSQSAMDFTGDGVVDSTDALLMMRHMMGTFPGDAITQGIPNIPDAEGLRQKIMSTMERSNALGGGRRMDIDGDGIINPLSDGLAITQYIHGKGRPDGMPQTPDVFKNPIRGFEEMQNHLEDLIGF